MAQHGLEEFYALKEKYTEEVNQRAALEKQLEELAPQREASRSPVPATSLVLEDEDKDNVYLISTLSGTSLLTVPSC